MVFMVLATPAPAVRTTGWATWTPITGTANNYATTMQLPALGFPRAVVATNSRSNVQLPSGDSTFLGGSANAVPTDVGLKYGSSKGNSYLNLRPAADNATSPSTTSYTFDRATPPTGWTFVLGDIDADQVQIRAKDAAGVTLTAAQIDAWKTGHNVFNYAGEADLPTWNAATSTLVGNPTATDTNGASAWFEPNISVSELTFVYTRRAGFPVYQTWFASVARTISGTITNVGGSCPIDTATLTLTGPDGTVLASTHPVGGVYSFGQYATQPGYVVSIQRPAACAVVGVQQQAVSTAAADAIANFDLRQTIPQPVSGRVTTAGGTPVAGVQITLTPPGGGTPVITTTDQSGNYLIDNNAELPGYAVAVTGVPSGYATSGPASRTFGIPVGTPVTGQDFVLSELPSVTGVITGGGDPLGGVTVSITATGGGSTVTTTTRGDGTYGFDHVPAGTYDITVTSPPGYNSAAPRTGVVVASADLSGQDFVLDRPGAVGGQVTDSSTGAAVVGAVVTVTGPGGPVAESTDAAGSYYLSGLVAGSYSIGLTVPSGFVAAGAVNRAVTITAQGEDLGGQDFTVVPAAVPAPVTPAGDTADGLANTGANPMRPLLVGVATLLLGLALVAAGGVRSWRRRGRGSEA